MKHVDKKMNHFKKRPSFTQNLEFYPVTRRAWNRALGITILFYFSHSRKRNERNSNKSGAFSLKA